MFSLIKLELKKFKFKGVLKGIIITNLILMVLILSIPIGTAIENDHVVENFPMLFELSDNMVRSTFIIYSSIILSALTIEEYKNKTINLMFMYPVNRKKLFISKILIAMMFAFLNIMFSNILLISSASIIDSFILDIIPGNFQISTFISYIPFILINALAASGMVLISLFFGMRKKSLPSMIVTSIIVVCIMCSNNGGYSLSNSLPLVSLVGIAGVLVSIYTFKNIENEDIL